MTERLVLTSKEAEAVGWGLALIGDVPDRPVAGPRDPLIQLRERYSEDEITASCVRLDSGFKFPDLFVNGPFSDCDKDVLRCCVENTNWLDAYEQNLPHLRKQAHATLPLLAAKLETIGIEITYIPPLNSG